jgi:DNA-binding XRE family transcriptional regulator
VVNELAGSDKQCANTFGVTKQRVGQIEKDLRGKLARHFTATFGTSGVNDMLRASF